MSGRGELGAFAEVLGNLKEGKKEDEELIRMIQDPNVSTSDIAEIALSDLRKQETRKLVDTELGELTEQERSNITDIVTSLASKIRTEKCEPGKDAPEFLTTFLVNISSVIGEEKASICLKHLREQNNS